MLVYAQFYLCTGHKRRYQLPPHQAWLEADGTSKYGLCPHMPKTLTDWQYMMATLMEICLQTGHPRKYT